MFVRVIVGVVVVCIAAMFAADVVMAEETVVPTQLAFQPIFTIPIMPLNFGMDTGEKIKDVTKEVIAAVFKPIIVGFQTILVFWFFFAAFDFLKTLFPSNKNA